MAFHVPKLGQLRTYTRRALVPRFVGRIAFQFMVRRQPTVVKFGFISKPPLWIHLFFRVTEENNGD